MKPVFLIAVGAAALGIAAAQASECEIKANRKSIKGGSTHTAVGLIKNDSNLVAKEGEKLVLTIESLGKEVALFGPTETTWKDLCANATIELDKGKARLRSIRSSKAAKTPNLQIKTKNAVMGVRGTDFLATFSPLLEESEVVVFDGKIAFDSLSDPADKKEINAGHWGGLGGRFGQKVTEPIELPKNALDTFHWETKF